MGRRACLGCYRCEQVGLVVEVAIRRAAAHSGGGADGPKGHRRQAILFDDLACDAQQAAAGPFRWVCHCDLLPTR